MAGHTGDVPTVIAGLTDPSPKARVVALGAAHRLEVLDAELVRAALQDEELDVRYRALELVARSSFGIELADRVIDALADDELGEVAAFVLGELPLAAATKERAVAALGIQATTHDDAMYRESAVAALGALGDGLPFILQAVGDVATVRRRAVLALAPFEGAEVDAALNRALEDRDWQVRQAAEDLLE